MPELKDIEEYGKKIGREFHPERVVLFGSCATGSHTEDSDVDLLVIMPFTGKSHQMASRIRRRIRPSFPMDLLVRRPETVYKRIQMGDHFLREIIEQGKVLYEAPDR